VDTERTSSRDERVEAAEREEKGTVVLFLCVKATAVDRGVYATSFAEPLLWYVQAFGSAFGAQDWTVPSANVPITESQLACAKPEVKCVFGDNATTSVP